MRESFRSSRRSLYCMGIYYTTNCMPTARALRTYYPYTDKGGKFMNKRNFYVGMGMGLVVGGCAVYALRPKNSGVKSVVGRTLKTMGEVADSVSELLGW